MATVEVTTELPRERVSEPESRSDGARSGVPFLEPRPGDLPTRFSEWLGTDRPALTFLAAALGGYLALAAAMIGLGLVLTHVLLRIGSLSAWDERVNDRLAAHRTVNLEHLSWIGSTLAGGLVIPVVIAFFFVTFLALHHWRLAAFVLFAVAIESGAYRVTTIVVPRERPTVDRLESLPVDASFPSGHTAASIALYGGLLLLLVSRVSRIPVTLAAWTLIALIPVFVAWSRMYRGMHHTTDSTAGVLLGIGALVVIVFACRAAGATADRRDGAEAGDA
ncbi:MAG TPA: phosphatase PAP2 family protein [Gaiellaceae bacterium]|nr:phosphatase PAP2 family protein [Gaiellaceae bacterium]